MELGSLPPFGYGNNHDRDVCHGCINIHSSLCFQFVVGMPRREIAQSQGNSFFFLMKILSIYLVERGRERESTNRGMGQREKEKQALC